MASENLGIAEAIPKFLWLWEPQKMNDDRLERTLRSIGKSCFVKYFCMFIDQSLTDRDIINILIRQEGYTESSSQTRVSKARKIIKSGRAEDTLRNIIQSERIPNYARTAADAKELLIKLSN